MRRITIYRMENEYGIGPYQAEHGYSDHINTSHSTNKYPAWKDDNILVTATKRERKKYYSGFKSIVDLKKWFAGHLQNLKAHGFAINSYKVDRSLIVHGKSKKQVAFIKLIFNKISNT